MTQRNLHPPGDPQRLEQSIDRLLRAQPTRRAPADFAQRVLAEIARREALPWWQKGFYAWPTFARVAFCALCLAIVAVALEIPAWLTDTVNVQTLPQPRAFTMWHTLTQVGAAFVDTLPMEWIYAAGGILALAYATVFGTSIATYRVLFGTAR
jgi:hypothetical protein